MDSNDQLADIRRRIDAAPMSRAQISAVAMTVILSALDGYDVLSVTFAAPAIALDWAIGKAALGIVLSSGLAGMAAGSLLLAPLADIHGRRKLVLASLALMAIGMLASAFATNVAQLAAWRVLAGLGIGTCVAVITPLAAEYANARQRPLTMAMMAMGYPAGGLLGGILASVLLGTMGWRAVFVAGFVGSAAMIPLVWRFLPEPASFLLSRPSLAGIERLNASLLSLGQTPLFALPPPATAKTKTGLALVLGRGQIRTTSALAAVNVLFAAAAYFVLSWLPQLISDAGFAPSRASLASALASASGIVGGLALGWIARNRRIDRTTALAMMSLAFALCAFGLAPASFGLLLTLAGVMGFFLFAGVAGLYATIASRVAPEARATASGLVIGMGRISSAVGPLVAGALFADNWGRAGVTAVFASCAFAAAIALLISGKTEPSR